MMVLYLTRLHCDFNVAVMNMLLLIVTFHLLYYRIRIIVYVFHNCGIISHNVTLQLIVKPPKTITLLSTVNTVIMQYNA